MSEAPSDWPAHLDAVVAAPEHHRLVMENERTRVLETLIKPGETTAMHTHCWPAVTHFLSWSDFVRRDGAGNVMLDSKAAGVRIDPGQAAWTSELGPHTLENVGKDVLHVITVEFKPCS